MPLAHDNRAARPPLADDPARPALGLRTFWQVLLLYFGAQVVVRVFVSDALELDEAEQVLWTQSLALGYGTQPPLYTWLQWLVFQVTGVSVFGLAVLKNALLACIYAFTALAARKLLSAPWAMAAAGAMVLLPQLGWEAQRDLTHSVLCTAAAAACTWLVLELLDRPRRRVYLALGVACAAGILAKYSFLLFIAALAAAMAASTRTRPLLLDRWALVAAAVAAALVAPHAAWSLAHLDLVSGGTLDKMQGSAPAAHLSAFQGLRSLGRAVAGFAAPLALVLVALWWWRRDAPAEASPPLRADAAALLGRYLALVVLALLAMALGGAASSFKARWLLPLLFVLPLAVAAAAPRFTTRPRGRALQGLSAVMALLVLGAVAARPAVDGRRGTPDELNLPAAALVEALRAAGWQGGTVRSDDAPLAAALRLHGAAQHASADDRPANTAAGRALPTLWIAPAGNRGDGAWPPPAARACVLDRRIELPYRHARPGAPPLRWRYCIAPPP